MSVVDALVKMKNYIEYCPTDDMKEAAKKDFAEALDECIKEGYTWGRRHELPCKVSDLMKLPRRDLYRLQKMLGNA